MHLLQFTRHGKEVGHPLALYPLLAIQLDRKDLRAGGQRRESAQTMGKRKRTSSCR